jgi:hypothetical protein
MGMPYGQPVVYGGQPIYGGQPMYGGQPVVYGGQHYNGGMSTGMAVGAGVVGGVLVGEMLANHHHHHHHGGYDGGCWYLCPAIILAPRLRRTVALRLRCAMHSPPSLQRPPHTQTTVAIGAAMTAAGAEEAEGAARKLFLRRERRDGGDRASDPP